MCFSATASFTAAIVLGTVGIGCQVLIFQKAKPSMTFSEKNLLRLFAAVPLLFASHQLSEGFVWLDPQNQTAVRIFAYTAYTFWPLYIPLSTVLIEWNKQKQKRVLPLEKHPLVAQWRRLISPPTRFKISILNMFLGMGLYLYCTWCVVQMEPLQVSTQHDRLDYETCIATSNPPFLALGRMIYVCVIVSSLALSSIQYSIVFATCVLLSAVLCYVLWQTQFESTWCYFAALISSSVLFCIWKELEAYPSEDDDDDDDNNNNNTMDHTAEPTGMQQQQPTETSMDANNRDREKGVTDEENGPQQTHGKQKILGITQ